MNGLVRAIAELTALSMRLTVQVVIALIQALTSIIVALVNRKRSTRQDKAAPVDLETFARQFMKRPPK